MKVYGSQVVIVGTPKMNRLMEISAQDMYDSISELKKYLGANREQRLEGFLEFDTRLTKTEFSNCNDLYIGGELVNQLVIPEMVTSIGQYAFGGCGSLTSVTIPNSVTMIGNGAFEACNEISVYYEGDIAQWCGISFGEWPFLANYNLYMENELVTQLEIPETVTSIGQYAFCGCGSLNSVTIPNSVVSIGYGAFCDCINLATVSMLATTPPVLGGWNIFSRQIQTSRFMSLTGL